jgi:hypothetical protein
MLLLVLMMVPTSINYDFQNVTDPLFYFQIAQLITSLATFAGYFYTFWTKAGLMEKMLNGFSRVELKLSRMRRNSLMKNVGFTLQILINTLYTST